MERKDEPVHEIPSQQPGDAGGKVPWQRPELVPMGHLKDFVQGAGKTGSKMDGDAQSFRRPPL